MARVFWTQQQPLGPGPRMGHRMAYDSVRKVVLLFGGRKPASEFGDTWIWDGTIWTQLADIGPSARAAHAMVFDEARSQMVLFGGLAGANALRDTWVWDGTQWTQVSDVGPSARSSHAMVYDRTRQRTVLFGGTAGNETTVGETWEWDGEAWTQQEDAGPGPRSGHSMAYDATRGRVVLFGGASETDGLAETWEWDGTVWSEVAHFGPSGRLGAALVFNGSRTTLFGGARSTSTTDPTVLLGDTWEWDGHHWTQQQHFGPAPRTEHAMAFDSNLRRIVMFGGSVAVAPADATPLRGDTWQHTPAVSALPTALASIEIIPATVVEGDAFTVRATLTAAATTPTTVALSVIPAIPDIPAQLVVPSGATSATSDPIPSPPSGEYELTATLDAVTRTATLAVTAVLASAISGILLLPNVRDVNEPFTVMVVLSAPSDVPIQVNLTSVPAIPGMPVTIPIGAGDNQGQVQFSSSVEGSFVVTASVGGTSASGNLTITPEAAGTDLASLQVVPETVTLPSLFTVVISIRNPATAPVNIALSSSPGIGTLPPDATIAVGDDTVFVSNLEAPSPGTYTISASAGPVTLDATLTVV